MTWGARGVTVRFRSRTALDTVTQEVETGEVAVVVGGDGAGKTTLLRVLVGALPIDSGQVRRPDPRRIGYLASTSGTYPDLSVEENLQFTAAAYGVSASHADSQVGELLERTGLALVRHRLAGNLSGGMRQKLGVVRAMLPRPDLIVLDEPTTGIDPVSRADLWWLIARAAAEGAAVVLTTVYLDEAERASRLLVLEQGRTLAQGSPAEIRRSVPGEIVTTTTRPAGPVAERAWRRRTGWRVWHRSHRSDAEGEPVQPDLQDAVIVATLARHLGGAEEPSAT